MSYTQDSTCGMTFKTQYSTLKSNVVICNNVIRRIHSDMYVYRDKGKETSYEEKGSC